MIGYHISNIGLIRRLLPPFAAADYSAAWSTAKRTACDTRSHKMSDAQEPCSCRRVLTAGSLSWASSEPEGYAGTDSTKDLQPFKASVTLMLAPHVQIHHGRTYYLWSDCE